MAMSTRASCEAHSSREAQAARCRMTEPHQMAPTAAFTRTLTPATQRLTADARQKVRPAFLKKSSKKLLSLLSRSVLERAPKRTKVFRFFF